MKRLIAMLVMLVLLFSVQGVTFAEDRVFSQHSYIFVNGYMDESRIFQSDYGFKGQKLAVGTRGSGMASRTQTVDFWSNSTTGESEIHFIESGYFEYHPYTPGPSELDLKKALCAKNYNIVRAASDSYSSGNYPAKEISRQEGKSISPYQINSSSRAAALIGARL